MKKTMEKESDGPTPQEVIGGLQKFLELQIDKKGKMILNMEDKQLENENYRNAKDANITIEQVKRTY
jgi:hypothetical protein